MTSEIYVEIVLTWIGWLNAMGMKETSEIISGRLSMTKIGNGTKDAKTIKEGK